MNPIVNPGQFVADIYNIALMLGGFLAFGAIVYGAVLYSIAAGNPSAQHEAKEWITQALVGLMLLFGAYMVLVTIDSDLPNRLALPDLTPLPAVPPANNVISGQCFGGCQPIAISNVTCKNGCTADQRVIEKLKRLYTREDPAPAILVTEAMPPSSTHRSPGHNNGCSIDVIVAGAYSCDKVQQLIRITRDVGLNPLNEYVQCGGTASPLSTGNHLHLTGC